MFAQNCIDSSIPFVRLTDETGFVLDLMQEYKTELLAVVDGRTFCGMISESILLEADDMAQLTQWQDRFIDRKISEGTHLFDILKAGAEYSSYYIPVVNAEHEYIGIVTPHKLLDTLTLHSSLHAGGGIIVLELEARNYSLTEISRIVESNNAMILHSMVASSAQQQQVQVAIKVNKNDLKEIQLAFERYQYTVIAVFHQSEYESQLKERYDSLMKYLEV